MVESDVIDTLPAVALIVLACNVDPSESARTPSIDNHSSHPGNGAQDSVLPLRMISVVLSAIIHTGALLIGNGGGGGRGETEGVAVADTESDGLS
jgi:hypothetical protein